MAQVGGTNMLVSPSAFQAHIQNRITGGTGTLAENAEAYEQQRTDTTGGREVQMDPSTQQVFDSVLLRSSQAQGSRGMAMPITNRNEQMGYSNVSNPQMFGMGTSLPFDEQTDKLRNINGIINGINPSLYNAGEGIRAQIQQMGPSIAKAVSYKPDLMKGMSTDFATNKLYILNQRTRENELYAFK